MAVDVQQRASTDSKLRIDSASTLSEHVYTTLRDEILAGTLRPGTRLVRRTLGRRLGVSAMPVVEALLRLEGDGLVENRAQCGARVKPLTMEQIRHDQFLREAIECQAARFCAENASAAELAALRAKAKLIDQLLPKMQPPDASVGRVSKEFTKDIEFHIDVVRCGGYPSIAEELGRVWFRRVMRLSWLTALHVKPAIENAHQKLVDALSSRNPDRAEAVMRAHLRHANDADLEALQHLLAQSVSP